MNVAISIFQWLRSRISFVARKPVMHLCSMSREWKIWKNDNNLTNNLTKATGAFTEPRSLGLLKSLVSILFFIQRSLLVVKPTSAFHSRLFMLIYISLIVRNTGSERIFACTVEFSTDCYVTGFIAQDHSRGIPASRVHYSFFLFTHKHLRAKKL